MTLNGVMAFILRYFTKFGSFRGALRKSGWRCRKKSLCSLSHLLMSFLFSMLLTWSQQLNTMVSRCTPMLMTRSFTNDKALSCDERLLRFIECISEIDNWMTSNRLKVNSDKTDFICLVLSNSWQRFNMPVNLPEWCSHPCLYWSHLFRGPVIQSAHFCPSNPTSVSPMFLLLAADPDSEAVSEVLNTDLDKALLHALIASRLDYCNSVLYRINTSAAKTLHFYTRPLDSSCGNGSLTASHRHLEMIFTGYQCHRGFNGALSSTGACIRLRHACWSQPPPVAVTCAQLLVETYTSAGNKNCQLWAPQLRCECLQNFGTVYHLHSEIRHWQWHIVRPAKKLIVLFSLRTRLEAA